MGLPLSVISVSKQLTTEKKKQKVKTDTSDKQLFFFKTQKNSTAQKSKPRLKLRAVTTVGCSQSFWRQVIGRTLLPHTFRQRNTLTHISIYYRIFHCSFWALVVFYLCDPRRLILLQLLLEAVVGADEGADSLDCGQALLPAVVSDGHQVGHHHGGAAGDACQAAARTGQHSAAICHLHRNTWKGLTETDWKIKRHLPGFQFPVLPAEVFTYQCTRQAPPFRRHSWMKPMHSLKCCELGKKNNNNWYMYYNFWQTTGILYTG